MSILHDYKAANARRVLDAEDFQSERMLREAEAAMRQTSVTLEALKAIRFAGGALSPEEESFLKTESAPEAVEHRARIELLRAFSPFRASTPLDAMAKEKGLTYAQAAERSLSLEIEREVAEIRQTLNDHGWLTPKREEGLLHVVADTERSTRAQVPEMLQALRRGLLDWDRRAGGLSEKRVDALIYMGSQIALNGGSEKDLDAFVAANRPLSPSASTELKERVEENVLAIQREGVPLSLEQEAILTAPVYAPADGAKWLDSDAPLSPLPIVSAVRETFHALNKEGALTPALKDAVIGLVAREHEKDLHQSYLAIPQALHEFTEMLEGMKAHGVQPTPARAEKLFGIVTASKEGAAEMRRGLFKLDVDGDENDQRVDRLLKNGENTPSGGKFHQLVEFFTHSARSRPEQKSPGAAPVKTRL